jgi:asparagine synthase (glutamine-hydrolysing)
VILPGSKARVHVFAGVYRAGGADETGRVDRAVAQDLVPGSPPNRAAAHGELALASSLEETAAEGVHDLVCVLDGSLENPADVADELEADPGLSARALIAAGYRRWGSSLVSRLRGTFALVIWDPRGHRGIVATDPLGARPVFFHTGAGGLAFASEIRVLLRLLERRPSPDESALVLWMSDGSLARGQTLYGGVSRLEGGHLLELDRGRWTKICYWSPRYEPPLQLPRSELVEDVRQGLARAVGSRLPPGGAAGVLLSGGLDSSGIAAVARLEKAARISTYSAVFPGHSSLDESKLIETTTVGLGLPSALLHVHGGSMLANSLEFLSVWEVPSPSPNLVFGVPLARLASDDGVAALLDGEGGDELFGLSPFLPADRLRRGRLVSSVKLTRRFPSLGDRPSWRTVRGLHREYALKGALPHSLHVLARRWRGTSHYGPAWLRETSARLYLASSDPWGWKELPGPRWWTHKVDQVTAFRERLGVHDFLRRKSALAGVVGVHPLLTDHRLVELALRLPPELGFDPHRDRPLVREALRGLLPDEVRMRSDKSDFGPFFRDCLTGADWKPLLRLLGAEDTRVREYVRADDLRQRFLEAPTERRSGGWLWTLWRLATAECWLRFQEDPLFPTRALETWDLAPARYDVTRVRGRNARSLENTAS